MVPVEVIEKVDLRWKVDVEGGDSKNDVREISDQYRWIEVLVNINCKPRV